MAPHQLCPFTGTKKECRFENQNGSVRDFPGLKLVRCSTCQCILHETSIENAIDYTSGSMRAGESPQLSEKPNPDDLRREAFLQDYMGSSSNWSMLDYGCGDGNLIKNISQNGNSCAGVEPEDERRRNLHDKGLRMFATGQEVVNENTKYDLITLFHVVEHLYDPSSELQTIKQLLKPGGILVIETPNSNDALISRYKSERFLDFTFWSHHPILYSKEGLEQILKSNGFDSVESIELQRYGIQNHLNWILDVGQDALADFLPLEENYSQLLFSQGISDTIFVIAKVSKVKK